ncbi:M23 family metallopeptidase [Caproicibacter sp.]|uniref:M23 family metallopeptidase n=1 Tax=Caproicibacter sp. TaxID=2814884 RepID=UPI00398A1343
MLFYHTGKALKTVLLLFLAVVLLTASAGYVHQSVPTQTQEKKEAKYIKYVEFNVSYLALKKAMNLDIKSHEQGGNLSWIQILAYLGAKYGGDFTRYKSSDMDAFVEKLQTAGIDEITKDMKYYHYYLEAYTAVLGGLLGKYREDDEEKYGLIGYSPIAKTFPYSECDDFGVQRTYGYSRPHLGHDMMAATGTPVIAVESGVVEALGWNQYGGWRIGIRSFDTKRYYYYAHLRQNRPYAAGLGVGHTVKAGDVIGYVGRTGYSSKENVNNIKVSHLHFGLQLVFDESQKECNNEIWVDVYALTKLLRQHQSEVYRVAETKEYYRVKDVEIES